MKFITIILFYLAISHSVMAATYKISAFAKKSTVKDVPTNKWYQLGVGLVLGALNVATSADVEKMKPCFPDGAAPANVDDDKSAGKSSDWITTILNGLSTLVDFLCKFKDQIAKLFGGLLKRNLMEKGMRRLSNKGVWDTLKTDLGKIKDWAKAAWDKTAPIRDFAKTLVDDLKSFFADIKTKIISLLPQSAQDTINKYLNCGAAKVAGNTVALVKGLVNVVQKVARAANGDAVALASIIIGLICKYAQFKQGWDHFKTAWTTADIPTKYNYYGRAFGVWFNAIATSKKKLALKN